MRTKRTEETRDDQDDDDDDVDDDDHDERWLRLSQGESNNSETRAHTGTGRHIRD